MTLHAKRRTGPSSSRLGRVRFVLHEDGVGFIETPEGEELPFSWDDVQDHAFDELDAGTRVAYVEVRSGEGAKATAVRPVPSRARDNGSGEECKHRYA